MIDNADELKRLAVFASVVEHGSFSAAARELGTTRSAVSRQISLLEERLGVQLLHRTTRSLRTTPAGLEIAQHAADIVRSADRAVRAAAGLRAEPHGPLRITAPIGPGQVWLAPRLVGFLQRFPRVEVHVDLRDDTVDLIDEGYDLAIRAGRLVDSPLLARRLASFELIVVGPPGTPRLRNPRQLAEMAWVAFTPLSGTLDFGTPTRPVRVIPRPVASTNDGEVLRTFVAGGLGLSALPRFYVEADLAAGRLVSVLPDRTIRAGAIYAVYPPGIVPRTVRALLDHLTAVEADPPDASDEGAA